MFPSHLPAPQHIWYVDDHDFSHLFCQCFPNQQILFCLFGTLHPCLCPQFCLWLGAGALSPWDMVALWPGSIPTALCHARSRSTTAASGHSFPRLPTVRRKHLCLFLFLNPGRRRILGAGCGDPAMYQWKEKKAEIVGSDFNSSGFSFFQAKIMFYVFLLEFR